MRVGGWFIERRSAKCHGILTISKLVRFLTRIANCYKRSSLQDLKSVLVYATESLWRKQEHFYMKATSDNSDV